jgi:putative copper resistance protein D
MATGFLWLWLAIANMSGSSLAESLQPSLFQMVLTQTQPGQVWMGRAVIAIAMAATLPFTRRPFALLVSALLAIAFTGSLAWLGHAGAGEGAHQNLHLTTDILHLVGAGIWPAGLVSLAGILHPPLMSGDPAALRVACLATRRFSTLSLFTVALLVISGIANSCFLIDSFHALVSTDYGRLLLLKLVLFAATLAVAAWNLLKLTPQLTVEKSSFFSATRQTAACVVIRNVLIEIGLSTLILLVVGLLGITAPAVHP